MSVIMQLHSKIHSRKSWTFFTLPAGAVVLVRYCVVELQSAETRPAEQEVDLFIHKITK